MVRQNKPSSFLLLLLLGSLTFLPGCVSPGPALEPSALGQLEVGQTQARVRELFGEPRETQRNPAGRQLDIFGLYLPTASSGTGPAQKLEVRSLHVLYDSAARVEKFHHHSGPLRGTAGKSFRAGHHFTPEETAQILPGDTTLYELNRMFGPPLVEGLHFGGGKVLYWVSLEGSSSGALQGQELAVYLDENEVVTDYRLRNLRL